MAGHAPGAGIRRCSVTGAQPAEPAEVGDLLPHPHAGVKAPFLRHVPEPPPGTRVNRAPAPPHRAAVGHHQAEQGAHDCGLTGAVRAGQPNHVTGRDLQTAPLQRQHLAIALHRPLTSSPGSPGRRGAVPATWVLRGPVRSPRCDHGMRPSLTMCLPSGSAPLAPALTVAKARQRPGFSTWLQRTSVLALCAREGGLPGCGTASVRHGCCSRGQFPPDSDPALNERLVRARGDAQFGYLPVPCGL